MHLNSFDQEASEYTFGAMFEEILKFYISIPVSAMTSPVAHIYKRWFTTSFKQSNMPSGLSKAFFFVRNRRDTKEMAAELVMKC